MRSVIILLAVCLLSGCAYLPSWLYSQPRTPDKAARVPVNQSVPSELENGDAN